jgi:hypothetical protein
MSLVKSKQRVADHGEVFTPAWMVQAMLDLVKDATGRYATHHRFCVWGPVFQRYQELDTCVQRYGPAASQNNRSS